VQVIHEECEALGGIWLPEYDDCVPTPPECEGTPVEPATWGRIKAGYR
jgi:hypothetical protein